MEGKTVGVIDIGANSIRLNMYKIIDGQLNELISKKNIAGLISYREKNILSEKGIKKLINTLNSLLNIYNVIGGDAIYAFATASLRDLDNQKDILKRAEKETGLKIYIIPQEFEGQLGLEGVLSEFPKKSGITIDIGGGSVEITHFNKNKIEVFSLKEGSLSLYKNFVSGILPEKNEIKKIKEFVRTQLSSISLDESFESIIGLGGSIRAAGNCIYELGYSDFNNAFTSVNLNDLYNGLKNQDEHVVKTVLQVVPERIHTITPGVIFLRTAVNYFQTKNIIVSKAGIREGFLIRAIRRNINEQE